MAPKWALYQQPQKELNIEENLSATIRSTTVKKQKSFLQGPKVTAHHIHQLLRGSKGRNLKSALKIELEFDVQGFYFGFWIIIEKVPFFQNAENKNVDRESATKGAKIGEYLKRERYKYTRRKRENRDTPKSIVTMIALLKIHGCKNKHDKR
ncbi:predicted protein [Histoplasma capsulatum G186AR]|uniref:Uncharacterized protein n=1 Tax=Ajellomyces capsulatus (strain G186AR / H82 / ATCC MYA-2454 / RMSCC 2432) TaxID=447093 RepID=C0NGP8_AJECG|nr:uncharacterized protein HCBG_02520 [Histoplasma capsulatum G186AR]EEH08983.1 predicted protein [Histoplasma capsulatum G186AR]